MTVVGICMAKDEADIVAETVGNMLEQVDYVIVADNASTDMTRIKLCNIRGRTGWLTREGSRLMIVDDSDPAYLQSAKMTRLAHLARETFGADWVVPFDADEWWTAGDTHPIRDVLDDTEGFDVVAATLYDHVATGRDPGVCSPVRRLGWRRTAPLPLPKVAARWSPELVIDQGNHSATHGGKRRPARGGLLAVHHFPYRSAEQFVRKVRNGAAAYAAGGSAIRADFGAHWRQWGQILDRDGEQAVVDIFRTWYYRHDPTAPVEIGGEWQEALLWDPVSEF